MRTLGLRVEPAALPELIALQRELRPAIERVLDVTNPERPDLAGIYGVIFWEPLDAPATDGVVTQRNVAVFADGEVDRSPCGSGTTARLAILHARGEIAAGARLVHQSIIGSAFDAWVVADGPAIGGHPSVVARGRGIGVPDGRAHLHARSERPGRHRVPAAMTAGQPMTGVRR